MRQGSSKEKVERGLRTRAERLIAGLDSEKEYPADQIQELVHELMVHQADLEIQRESFLYRNRFLMHLQA